MPGRREERASSLGAAGLLGEADLNRAMSGQQRHRAAPRGEWTVLDGGSTLMAPKTSETERPWSS